MKIIPAIDIINGKCVRLTKGDYKTEKIYREDPLEAALEFQDHGIQFLHLVDLDGAKKGKVVNHKTLERIALKTDLIIDYGGGLKSDSDLKIAFESGANQITGGSVAVQNKSLFLSWLTRYGPQKIILGADCKNRKIATNAWLNTSDLDVVDFIKEYERSGIQEVVSTDIAKDGMLKGPAFEMYQEILRKTKVQLIASGGISNVDDLLKLRELGCSGAIIGKAIYEGKIPLSKLQLLC